MGENFVYASIDVNGLKIVNDEIGHAAGDELIKGAADCMAKAFGSYGKVYRTGGDEFVSIFFANKEQLVVIKEELESITGNWSGELVSLLALSVGYVAKSECEDETILDMAKLADKRMYQAKSAYYAKKGVDRRGQTAANSALCNLYVTLGRFGERKKETVQVPIDEPHVVKKMYDLHLSELDYTPEEMTAITGLMLDDIKAELLNETNIISLKR